MLSWLRFRSLGPFQDQSFSHVHENQHMCCDMDAFHATGSPQDPAM